MSNSRLIRAYHYEIRTYQVDSEGYLTLHHLFNLFQDVAHRDALKFGFGYPQMLQQGRLWVLSRLTVEIDQLPRYDDEVVLQTWVKSISGPSSEREFALVLNDQRIVRATSLWFSLSVENHRPAAIPMITRLEALRHDEKATAGGAEKVIFAPVSSLEAQPSTIMPRPSDVDLVNHVNNAAYVRWVSDEIRLHRPTVRIKGFTINYLSEVHLGEVIELRKYAQPDGTLFHELVREGTGQVVCKTKTVWHSA